MSANLRTFNFTNLAIWLFTLKAVEGNGQGGFTLKTEYPTSERKLMLSIVQIKI